MLLRRFVNFTLLRVSSVNMNIIETWIIFKTEQIDTIKLNKRTPFIISRAFICVAIYYSPCFNYVALGRG